MLLNSTLILIKSIIATHLNRTLTNPMPTVSAVTGEAIDLGVPKVATHLGEGGETEIVDALRETHSWITSASTELEIKLDDIKNTIKLNIGFESPYITETLTNIPDDIDQKDDDEKIRTIMVLLSELSFFIKKKKAAKKAKEFQREISSLADSAKTNELIKTFIEELKLDSAEVEKHPAGFVGEFSTDDEESMERIFENTKKLNTDEGTLRLPLKALKKGLGNLWFRRGDLVCFKARSNHYKSGALLDVTKWLPHYNEPQLSEKGKEEGKKPLILRVSFENTPEQDALTIYKSIMEHKLKEKIDISKIDPKEAAKEVKEYFEINGYKVAIICFDPNKFDVWKLIDVLTYYELNGYEIHAVICDYLEIVAKALKGQRQDSAIANSFEVVRNHCMPKRITFFTAHQLNTASGETLNEVGSAAFPRKVAQSGGLYDHNCRSLIQKLDIEIILHRHLQGDEWYLGWGIGKLREREALESHKYFWYKFQQYGGIVPEEGDEDLAFYTLSSMSESSDNEESSEAAW